jgi:hypothetical protein
VGNSLRIYWWQPFRRERWLAALKENIEGAEEGR